MSSIEVSCNQSPIQNELISFHKKRKHMQLKYSSSGIYTYHIQHLRHMSFQKKEQALLFYEMAVLQRGTFASSSISEILQRDGLLLI